MVDVDVVIGSRFLWRCRLPLGRDRRIILAWIMVCIYGNIDGNYSIIWVYLRIFVNDLWFVQH